MSRIVVKNLPKKVKEERLREFFSTKGTVTDLQLKYTKEGVFRRFAFVGFKDEAQAAAAKEYFNNAYLDTSKLQVEICAALGDAQKPRSWSKYSADSSAYQRLHPETKKPKPVKEKSPRKNFADEFLKDLEGNEEFEEFLKVHGTHNKVTWDNDTRAPNADGDAKQVKPAKAVPPPKSAAEEEEEDSADEEEPKDDSDKAPAISKAKKDDKQPQVPQQKQKPKLPVQEFAYTLKVKGLPYNCKKKQIKDFFKPAKVASLRLPPKVRGIAYLGFKKEQDMKQALNKHHSFMAGHRLDVTKYAKQVVPEKKWRQFEDLGNPQDTLADTGRIFIRNLSYTITEEELEELFKKYGPLEEVHLSIDRVTRKPKGFAFVSFLFPEHAIRAFTELDGQMLQGRLLHLLPAKAKKSEEEEGEGTEAKSYKDKKEEELKKSSGRSHNWNTLFLGANALADVMAERYATSKQELLGTETGESVAVRMALGETQVVAETREFLESNGVVLDAFSRPATERSKTVILVKNLPAKTPPKDLHSVFGKFGILSRVVLPPWGVTALIEFQDPTEARAAFRRLAYSKFKHVPLYLEWAPTGVFSTEKKGTDKSKTEGETKADTVEQKHAERPADEEEEAEEEEDMPPEPDTTLFIKNLNFSTNEEAVREHFEQCGPIHEVTIAKKKDTKNPGQLLSMGYGFVQFKQRKAAKQALKQLQHSKLDGHALELKLSTRATTKEEVAAAQRKKVTDLGKEGTKILVRNIPFQANQKEVQDLFSVFGTLRGIRLPRKIAAGGRHRGFGFVEFLTKNDAKRAFEALCQSTHLYGRRLVLEWASTDDQEVDTLRKKTADHFLRGGPSSKRLKKSDLMATLDASGQQPDADWNL
ncbi:LOW QUALITY PROTEIN: probable RNA-binding protein 19 [Rhipicephalus sanguineus]|uniref:LOW QUALITY PROTEIN: probable RNA-binding protein 19 n=1 Tax=Rhipicephalus sanguineus TaxID=34632 RepID=UPI0018944874|nr:LOW QUALITY PROTEIN: probable RNA-binding protein 19 [Rhipicephalus sanguineus]